MKKRNWIHSGTLDKHRSERELGHGRLARQAAAESIVLLKNEGLLPIKKTTTIALLGCGADKTIKGGRGSGEVNNRESISIYRGLKEAGASIVSSEWLAEYEAEYEEARNAWREKVLENAKYVENPFDAYASNPFFLSDGRAVEKRDIEGAEIAVYVISRMAGEGKDRRKAEGDYYLSEREQGDILYLHEKSIPTVLILNTGGPVELTDILQKADHIKAVLNISQLGQEGGHAVADILFGKTVPCGRLTTTWAKRYEDYPSAEKFGYLNGDLQQEEYREGIYVGYRYFDSFEIEPLFPFGYGLSYTDFAIRLEELQTAPEGVNIVVTVENIGESYSGKEVVQVYLVLPQNDMAREFKRLAGFVKTDVLQPKEKKQYCVHIDRKQFASFYEKEHAWIIDAGMYGVEIGNSIDSVKPAGVLHVETPIVVEETKQLTFGEKTVNEMSAAKGAGERAEAWIQNARKQDILIHEFVPCPEEKRVLTKTPATEQSVEELIPLLYGNITKEASTLGMAGTCVPGSAGETTKALEEKYGVRSLVMADGPAGLRLRKQYQVNRSTNQIYDGGAFSSLEDGFLDTCEEYTDADTYYQYCTAFPVGTALAQTWDTELMQQFGEAVAREMEEFHVDLWLAPGMNIHRNPLCGRNFEYYSEDPFLSGCMAAAVTNGVQKNGRCGVTVKHFACNNQEDNRMGVNVKVSERTLREIYLRGFEIAVKKSAPAAIMSSYNLLHGVHAANSKDICTTIARSEWGFEGVIMSDWDTTGPKDGSVPWQCVAAGNDIIMPGSPKDDADIRAAYAKGELSEEAIRTSAGRVLAMIQRLTAEKTEGKMQ